MSESLTNAEVSITRLRSAVADAVAPCFFALMRLIEQMAEVGLLTGSLEETVRVRHDPSLSFRASDYGALEHHDGQREDDRLVLETGFLGLFGQSSPLPMYLVEDLAGADDFGARKREFIDIFHRHLLVLLYRLVKRADFPSGCASTVLDPWSLRVLALTGFDAYSASTASAREAPARRRLVALFARRARTPRALAMALSVELAEFLGPARVELREFVGTWIGLDPSERTQLGRNKATLGRDVMLGASVFDRGCTFRVRVGVLDRRAFANFLPGRAGLRRLTATVDAYSGSCLEYDIELVLADGETPCFALRSDSRSATLLGVDSWLDGARETTVRLSPSGHHRTNH